ncbi:MAG: outer membrane protein transport protein, partial [Planctomycetota bacterium]
KRFKPDDHKQMNAICSLAGGMNAMKCSQIWIVGVVLLLIATPARGAGTYLSSGGPISQSMGGASTAAPLDPIGALHWNPATASGLNRELGVGFGLLQPLTETRSSIAGLGGGASESESGVAILPSIGWIHRADDSPVTFGLGVMSVAGFSNNFEASATNPFFLPQSNTPGVPGGFGRVYTRADFLQIAPIVSVSLSESFSVAAGPTLTLGQLFIDPLVTTAPNDADGSGAPRYSSGRASRVHFGGGFQLGAYYITDTCWHFGASLKSPQWMEEFRYFTEDELGLPAIGRAKLDLPMILSLGTAYSGLPGYTLAMDVRYYDYKNTDGFGPHGFNADGSINGLGMSSVMQLAFGVQYEVSDDLQLRAGYTYNQNPFQDAEATFSVAATLIYQHQLAAGFTKKLTENVSANFAYTYYPENSLTGPIVTPTGAIPGSSVTTELQVHHLNFGVGIRY